MMGRRSTSRPAIVLEGLLLIGLVLGTDPAAAQDYRFGFNAYAGSAAYGDMAAGSGAPVLLADGGFTGAQAELWFGRFGARLHGGFASTALEDDGATGFGVIAGDIDLVARLRWPRPGLFFQPYAVVGGGAVRYDLGSDASSVGGQTYDGDPATRASLVLGIGTDLGSGPVAVRLELMDIIGLTSPLSRVDGSRYGPVQHVVLTFGLGVRAGQIDLPTRPIPVSGPSRPTVPVQRPRPPGTRPPPDASPPTRPIEPSEPDDPRPPLRVPEPQEPERRKPEPPQDTTPRLPPPSDPIQGSGGESEPGEEEVHGRLFALRVSWNPADAESAQEAERMAGVLEAAGLPVLRPEIDGNDWTTLYRRVGALRNAADARRLGSYIEDEYGLAWAWIHIDKDEVVPIQAVAASHSFVDALRASPGNTGRRAEHRGR